jgi:hypothetical protein
MNHPEFEASLRPFVLTMGSNVQWLNLDVEMDSPITVYCIEDEANAEFCSILNRGNQAAFGGPGDMGMPLWVMLDCAILPSAMVGFMLPREQVSDEIIDRLEIDDDYDGYVPISEYCACPTVEPNTVSGFSLHSHVPGRGVATRTKALGLLVMGARRQIGVTQFENPSIRVHVRFGSMEVKIHRPIVHTHSDDTFVYSLDLPSDDQMSEMARGESEFGAGDLPPGQRWSFLHDDELAHGRLRQHLQRGGRAWVIPPGWRATEEGYEISMVLGE